MNNFAHSIGQSTASLVDGAQDLLEDSLYATKAASTAFATAYAEQHALNLRRRAERRAARELRTNPAYALALARRVRRPS